MTQVLSFGDIVTDGNPDDFGVAWTCQTFTGWGSPGGTLTVTQRSQDHGGWGGNSFLKPRVLTAAGRLVAPDQATAVAAVDRLCAALSLDATTLVVSEDGVARQCAVRRDDDVLATWETDVIVTWSVQLIAQDPRRYATDLISVSTGLPSSSGGLTWPATWPISWPATVTSGVLGVDLVGNISTRPRFIITGPCSDPVITLVGTGHVLSWDVDLVTGQYLDIDVDRRTSLLNGQVSRSGSMTSRDWFDLVPGHSDIAFNAAAYDPGASLTVTCRSAWL